MITLICETLLFVKKNLRNNQRYSAANKGLADELPSEPEKSDGGETVAGYQGGKYLMTK